MSERDRRPKYRIVPAVYNRFRLERKGWFLWETAALGDDYDTMVETVSLCGGVLIHPPTNPKGVRPMSENWQPIETAPKDGTVIRAGTVSRMSIGGEPLYPLTSKYIDGKWQSVFGDNRWAPYDPQPTVWQPFTPPAKGTTP